MSFLRILLIALGVLLIIYILAVIAVSVIFYNLTLNRKTYKKMIGQDDSDDRTDKSNSDINTEDENKIWFFDNYKEKYITSHDNLKLKGYLVENSRSDIWAVVIHGYIGRGSEMAYQAKHFYDRGYSVLVPNLRGNSSSEGECIGMGWLDRLDIMRWIDSVIEINPNAQIILYGISMGAATVMMTIGEKLPHNVKLAIEDCGYTSVWDEYDYVRKIIRKLPSFPFMQILSLMTKLRAGYGFKEASCLKQVAKAEIPILFIHGKKDKFVPFHMLNSLYNAAKVPKDILEVDEAEHAVSSFVAPELYWNKVDSFIDTYL